MQEIPVSKRIEMLRNQAMNCPRRVERFQPGKLRRQSLLYYQGWMDCASAMGTVRWLSGSSSMTLRMRRSMADAYVLKHMRPVVREGELIVGGLDLEPLDDADQSLLNELERQFNQMAQPLRGRRDHMALDYKKLLEVGVEGLILEINERRTALDLDNPEDYPKHEFYTSCLIELEGVLDLQARYAAYLKELAVATEGDRAQELLRIAGIVERVPAKPVGTFHEALQSIHFYTFTLKGLFQAGRPDQYLLPYYRADLEAGRLTPEKALELIDCFNMQYNFYIQPFSAVGYMVGGRTADGMPVQNELTWLFLQSIAHVRMPYPGVGIAISEKTDEKLLSYVVELLSRGLSHPAIFNDDKITEALQKHAGMPVEHACDYVHSSCVEITPCARSGIWICCPYYNCAEMLMTLLSEHRDFKSLDELIEGFGGILKQRVKDSLFIENMMQLERARNGGELMRVACLVNECLEKGKSVDEGGAQYNFMMPNFNGISNVIDSMAAINTLVFQQKSLTLDRFCEVLENDYKGSEALRQQIINHCPHYGTNEPLTDAIAKRVYALVASSCEGLRTFRGAKLHPGAFSYNRHMLMGNVTMATPDGRKAGYPLHDGSSPVQGREINGPTASILSSTEWDHSPFIGGIAVNMKLNKSVMTDKMNPKICALIRTYLKRGGFEIQINCVSLETLQEAQKTPEQYRDLMVRIGGYSDFFTTQTPEMQQEIIDRTAHEA